MRTALAIIVATANTGTISGDLKELHDEVAADITEAYWKGAELNQNFKTFNHENYLNGEFPVVKVFNIVADGVRQSILIEPTALPFSVYMDQAAAYENLVDDLTKEMASDFISRNSEHQIKFNATKAKIEAFIKPFTSPAKLLAASPEFKEHFPPSYFDDSAEAAADAVSIADLLAA